MYVTDQIYIGVSYQRDLKGNLQCNELNRDHSTFFCQSQDEYRTKKQQQLYLLLYKFIFMKHEKELE